MNPKAFQLKKYAKIRHPQSRTAHFLKSLIHKYKDVVNIEFSNKNEAVGCHGKTRMTE